MLTIKKKKEIFDSKALLEKTFHTKITTFTYPSGKYRALTLSLVKKAGYTLALSTHRGFATLSSSERFILHRIDMTPEMMLTQALDPHFFEALAKKKAEKPVPHTGVSKTKKQ